MSHHFWGGKRWNLKKVYIGSPRMIQVWESTALRLGLLCGSVSRKFAEILNFAVLFFGTQLVSIDLRNLKWRYNQTVLAVHHFGVYLGAHKSVASWCWLLSVRTRFPCHVPNSGQIRDNLSTNASVLVGSIINLFATSCILQKQFRVLSLGHFDRTWHHTELRFLY